MDITETKPDPSRLVRVLVVEDNRHLAAMIQAGLRSAIHRDLDDAVAVAFRTAEDGHTALELLRREAFDALVVDVYLPGLDGPHVIAQARNELGLTKLSIVAMSAGGDAARNAALSAGANIFIDKPIRVGRFTDELTRLLQINARSWDN